MAEHTLLITGAQGFVGRNLVSVLRQRADVALLEYDLDTDPALLADWAARCTLVFHLAGVNRPQHEAEFLQGNRDFTDQLLQLLERQGRPVPVMITSSTQAALDNPYGRSKRAGEQVVCDYGRRTGAPVYVYRLPNLFGKWCRPNYNSAVATFCHHIARDLPIQVNDPSVQLTLMHIDDLVDECLQILEGQIQPAADGFCHPLVTHTVTLGRVVELLQSFHASRQTLQIPDLSDPFIRKLYSTYISYLPEDGFAYPLTMHCDDRGSFTEALKSPDRGQVSVNISRPGIVKGNHWHRVKHEKFLVVAGEGVIRFRRVGTSEVIAVEVRGSDLQMVDIPPGYTHNIENLGSSDMVTLMWANEPFDPQHPDTYFEVV